MIPWYEKIVIVAAIVVIATVFVQVGFSSTHDLVSYNSTIDCKNIEYSTNQTLNLMIMKKCIGKGGEGE